MAITFQREHYCSKLREESLPLIDGHHAEVSGIISDLPARVPHEHYTQLEELGRLRFYTARNAGALVGYAVFAVVDHHQHGVPCAMHDTMFLHPSERKGMAGVRFIQFCEEQLKADGAAFVTQHSSMGLDISPLLKRLGYQVAETIYIKRLN